MDKDRKVNQTILAFDYGDQHIGVAISEAGHPLAQPLTTIDTVIDVWSQVGYLIKKYQPDIIVVGWPRGLDLQTTNQTKMTEAFADELKRRLSVKVVLQDEAVTSEEALKRLPKKLPERKRKQLIHQYAAQIILEDFLKWRKVKFSALFYLSLAPSL